MGLMLRVHCAEALGTPIVGDYKYGWFVHSKWKRMPRVDIEPTSGKPYRLRRLEGLDVQKGSIMSKVPLLHLHYRELMIPKIAKCSSKPDMLRIVASMPSHMKIIERLINHVQCRLKLLRNKKESIIRQLGDDAAQLIRDGHAESAFSRYRALLEEWTSRMWTKYMGVLIWKTQNPWTGLRGQFYDHFHDQTTGFYGYHSAAEPIHVQLNLATYFIWLCSWLLLGYSISYGCVFHSKNLYVTLKIAMNHRKLIWLHECVGSALGAMWPKHFLTLLPLNMNSEELSAINVWLFPILKQYTVGASSLNFFKKSILGMVIAIRQKCRALEEQGKIFSSRSAEALVYSLWSLLPSFCNYPLDIADSFKNLENELRYALRDEPNVRGIICSSLQMLIQQNKSSGRKL